MYNISASLSSVIRGVGVSRHGRAAAEYSVCTEYIVQVQVLNISYKCLRLRHRVCCVRARTDDGRPIQIRK